MRLATKKTNMDICNVLGEGIDLYQDEITKNNITVEFNTSSNAELHIFADPQRLHRLFSNLIFNSLRYTDVGGGLDIEVTDQNDNLCIKFQDSSPSVNNDNLSKLFERLYRVDNSRNRKLGGAGLGLFTCKNIVDAHPWTIEVTPSSFGGLCICIVRPKNSNA